jgi:tetratricopeptide (TPR) repeat protein
MRGFVAGAFILCLAARSLAQPAQPATPGAPAPPAAPAAPDYARATELYNAATQAMTEGRGDDAARDFLAAFEITKDPVLFFKIGSAYEKAGKCSEAIGYYERYLAEAKPAESFVTLTKERIAACKATLPAAKPQPPTEAAKPAELSPPPAAPIEQPSKNKDRAWLFVGGSLAFVTAGAVLAYSAESAEQDVKDLYVSNNGGPPEFDAETKERYDDLVAEGNRYQYLSWASFGLAAGCAIGATIFFLRDRNDVSVTPVVTPKETGVSATLRF